jgi:type 1 glutamine amidotransferase
LADRDFAISWIKHYGKGRVFYTFLGHNPHIDWNAPVLQHFLNGIQFALGDLVVKVEPGK